MDQLVDFDTQMDKLRDSLKNKKKSIYIVTIGATVHWVTLIIDTLENKLRFTFLDSYNLNLKTLLDCRENDLKEMIKAKLGDEFKEEKFKS